MKKNTINSQHIPVVLPEEFEVLVDDNPPAGLPPVIGLLTRTKRGEEFITPMEYAKAKELSDMMHQILRKAAPELFRRP
jgi:hypothetical protein